jgi:hypothetical protein
MKLTKTMFLAALAISGLLTCGQLRAQPTPPAPPMPPTPSTNAPPMPPRGGGIDRLAQALNLTDDQKAQVQTILDNERQKMMAIRQDDTLSADDKKAKGKALRDDLNAQMKNILNDDQYQKWMSMQARMRRMSPPPPPAPPMPPSAPSGASAGTNAPSNP